MALYVKPLAFICYANTLHLLRAMRVLEGHRTFAESLGQIMFKGSKKTFILKKIFFTVFYFVFYCLEGQKYQKHIEHTFQLHYFILFYLYGCAQWHNNTYIISMVSKQRCFHRCSFFSWYYNTCFYLSIIGCSLYTFQWIHMLYEQNRKDHFGEQDPFYYLT